MRGVDAGQTRRKLARRARAVVAAVAGACSLHDVGEARAGGFELPDLGAQALGRGGAFVAKADDPTALYYNPAGLARQRGTRLLASANLFVGSATFQRRGRYPDDPTNPGTPWGDRPYAPVTNQAGPAAVPFVALTTDFGSLDRLTAAVGIFGASSSGRRTFGRDTDGAPAASRYDLVDGRETYLHPSAALAYRITPWLDVGVAGHVVLASVDRTWMQSADAGQCPNPEYAGCDSETKLDASGATFAATFGVLLRPSARFALGASFVTPSSITAKGTLTPSAVVGFERSLSPGTATYVTKQPWKARLGLRYVSTDRDFEVYDLELDAVYEAWNAAQGDGARLTAPTLGGVRSYDVLLVRGYRDTVSMRGGGAYNFAVGPGVLAARAGAYVETAAANIAYTRLDHDALAKVAGALGVGYTQGPFVVELSYAAVASLPRSVGGGDGLLRSANLGQRGAGFGADGRALPDVNEGSYRGFTHVLALGASFAFDALFAPRRKVRYGNDYEPGVDEEGKAAKSPSEEERPSKGPPEEAKPAEAPPPPEPPRVAPPPPPPTEEAPALELDE